MDGVAAPKSNNYLVNIEDAKSWKEIDPEVFRRV